MKVLVGGEGRIGVFSPHADGLFSGPPLDGGTGLGSLGHLSSWFVHHFEVTD